MHRLSLVLLCACSLDVPVEDPARSKGSAPPSPPTVTASTMVLGEMAHFRVDYIDPGDSVWILASTQGEGPGPCPAVLGSECVSLLQPKLLAALTADVNGQARTSVRVPSGFRPSDLFFQAVGTGLAGPYTTPVIRRAVYDQPTLPVEICNPTVVGPDPVTPTSMTVNGDLLEVSVDYQGCLPHVFRACWDGAFIETDTLLLDLNIAHDAGGDTCTTPASANLRFDLSTVLRGDDSIGVLIDSLTDLYVCTDPLSPVDSDADGVPDFCDRCEGGDDYLDADSDWYPDACDVCAAGNDVIDPDEDGIPSACDACPWDNPNDSDNDGVCESIDACPGGNDMLDGDGDGTADACDVCPADNPDDPDADGICTAQDICPAGDDSIDGDADGTPDACDPCPSDSPDDSDNDTVCDSVDICAAGDDRLDSDGDGAPDACDICPADNPDDPDADGICTAQDICPAGDDLVDADLDGVPDACDPCPNDSPDDTDNDGVCTSVDVCEGSDDALDSDGDSIPDGCDACPNDNPNDPDLDTLCTTDEIDTHGTDPNAPDTDLDGLTDDRELALGTDPTTADSDADGISDGVEVLFLESDPLDPAVRSRQPDLVFATSAAGRGLAGASVSVIDDINGDGLDEFLVGAPGHDGPAGTDAGRVYVVYGTASDLPIDLDAVASGVGGFALDGLDGGWDVQTEIGARGPAPRTIEVVDVTNWLAPLGRHQGPTGDSLGTRTASLGDFDGDGVGDFAFSAPWARVAGEPWGGGVFVVSGATASSSTSLADLRAGTASSGVWIEGGKGNTGNGTQEYEQYRITNGDVAGYVIDGGFDFNGDGLGDLVLYSHNSGNVDPEGMMSVVFGRPVPLSTNIENLSATPDGLNIRMGPIDLLQMGGFSPHVASVGDVNGDGYSDLLVNTRWSILRWAIGDRTADQFSYLLFGGPDTSDITITDLDPARVRQISHGNMTYHLRIAETGLLAPLWIQSNPLAAARPIGGGGDVNGDGYDDVIFTGVQAGTDASLAAWVAFGGPDGVLDPISALEAGTGDGFAIHIGERFLPMQWVRVGVNATIVQDMNGDGLDEIALGWDDASSAGFTENGRVHVIWGKTDTAPVLASQVEDGIAGMLIEGDHDGAGLGEHLDGSGDVDGDGLGDLVMGAPDHYGTAGGSVAVVRGANLTGSIFRLGDAGDDAFDGLSTGETLVGGAGHDTLRGNGGPDVLYGGSGDDRIEIADASFVRCRGGSGTDTLALVGPSWTLEPDTFRGRLEEIEVVDLTAPGPHVLSMARQDVLGLQDLSNDLFVDGTPEDAVVLTGGEWFPYAQEGAYIPYRSGRATVFVTPGVPVRFGTEFALDPMRFDLLETVDNGFVVGDVRVIDASPVTYTVSIDPLGAFGVNSAGQLIVTDHTALDFETLPSVELTVSAQNDQGVITTARVFVTMLDGNEPPVWTAPMSAMTVAESAIDGTLLAPVEPAPLDPDAGDTFVYSIESGNDEGIFGIDPASGVVFIADSQALDFETQPQHTLTIRATDVGGATSVSPPVFVDVTNVTIVSAPLSLTYQAIGGRELWQDTEQMPNIVTLNQEWASRDTAGAVGDLTTWRLQISALAMEASMQGRVLIDIAAQALNGSYGVVYDVETEVTYPDVTTIGTAFDFDTTLVFQDGQMGVNSPSYTYGFGLEFIDFELAHTRWCAVGFCGDRPGFPPFNVDVGVDRVQPSLFYLEDMPAQTDRLEYTMSKEVGTEGFDVSWAPHTLLALQAAGLPSNVGEVDIYPFGVAFDGYRFNYTVFDVRTGFDHVIDYSFTFSLDTVPYVLTLEDGTELPGELGTTLPITLPAGADANADGRVDFTMAITPEPTWTTASDHTTTYAADIFGMQVRPERIDYLGQVVGSWPEDTMYESQISVSGNPESFSESHTIPTNTHVLRGSFDLAQP